MNNKGAYHNAQAGLRLCVSHATVRLLRVKIYVWEVRFIKAYISFYLQCDGFAAFVLPEVFDYLKSNCQIIDHLCKVI